ncbi:Protein NRT1/ PTR FAMILY 6.4, partial [Cucurbita argyrosperma subsp. sororia]
MVLVSKHGGGGEEDAAVDFRGNPVDKSRTGGWLAAGLILGTELSERICVMGISMNLVTYLLWDLHLSSAKSSTIVTNFLGALNLLGLLCGFLADAKLGRFLTVATFASITAVGVILLTLATTIPGMRPPHCDISSTRQLHQCIAANGGQLAMLYAALYTIALGGGGIKSNVSGFRSDQFDVNDPKEEKAMLFFFNRFYFAISIGSLFAVIVFKKPRGSPLTVIWRVLLLAWKKRSLPHPVNPRFLNDYQNAKVPYTYRCLDKAAILDEVAAINQNRYNPWIVSTVTEVEEVQMVLKLLPIWSTGILFWTIYSQMTTFTVEQASFMDRKVGKFVIPAGSMSAFLFIAILLVTSMNEKLFIPIARKLTHNVQGLTSLQRIGIGLVFSIFGMVAAGVVEKERRAFAVGQNTLISVFWLIPQFFLVGAGEAFAYVGQLEFFIREAPERMKSMSTGLFLSTLSMGFFASSLLVTIVENVTNKQWLKSNLNKGNLNYFYWLLAVLGLLNFLFFLLLARKHQYKDQHYSSSNDNNEELKSSSDKIALEMEGPISIKTTET